MRRLRKQKKSCCAYLATNCVRRFRIFTVSVLPGGRRGTGTPYSAADALRRRSSWQALIDDLLLVFELENQDLAQVLDEYGEPLQLRAVIVEAVMALAEPMKEKQIAIRNRLKRDYTVWGLNDSLQDVFYRVLDNALKFSNEYSEVIVTDRSYQDRLA
jgi:K+-sensing histidine kinase KdpD